MAGPRGAHDDPDALGALLDRAVRRLGAARPAAPPGPAPTSASVDGFVFSGNRHDAVPRALLLDRRLTPLERNAWQVFRLLLDGDGVTRFPTYDRLAPYLVSMPGAARASHETVARTLTVLRLARWISLVRRRRDPKTGRILGNLYVLHDEPLTPYEAIQLDADYLDLVSQALDHAGTSVRRIGLWVLKDMAEDPLLRQQVLPTRLQTLARRMADRDGEGERAEAYPQAGGYPQAGDNLDSEDGDADRLRNGRAPSSESEVGENSGKTGFLRNPKTDRTVRIKNKNKPIRIHTDTVPRAPALRFPERFLALKPEQRAGALAALQAVDADSHQAILDEWEARCRDGAIRNPAGYLFGIVQKALRGEFRAWAGQDRRAASATGAAPGPLREPPRTAGAGTAQVYIDQLQSLLHAPRDKPAGRGR